MNLNEKVLKALSTVIEPDLKKDLVTLNMIEALSIEGDTIQFTVVLTTPACPLKDKIENDCKIAIANAIGSAYQVNIVWTARVFGNRTGAALLSNIAHVIAVSSGKGGVGKSTVAANLALGLAATGAKVGLMDADIYGPSLPLLFDLVGKQPEMQIVEGVNKIVPIVQYGIECISIGLLIPEDQAVVWRGPMVSSALRQFMTDVKWSNLDYLVIDMPPGTGDIHLTLAQTAKVSGAIVVTTPQNLSTSDAYKGASMFSIPQINIPILGVVENMSWFSPDELPENKYFVYGNGGGQVLADKLKTQLIAQIPVLLPISTEVESKKTAYFTSTTVKSTFDALAGRVAQKLSLLQLQNPEYTNANH